MKQKESMQKVLDYIEENLKTEISAQELAECAGFSLFHYYKIFQSEMGMPIMQYILRRRLLHAIYEMAQGAKKVDVAQSYGFDTYAGFYKAFKREIGFTPAFFLKKYKVKRPYRINLMKEEIIMITHKGIADILKNWDLEQETVTDVYYEGTGNRNENAYYVGDNYVLKVTTNLGKLKKHMELSMAIEGVGLNSATIVKTVDAKDFVEEGELYYYLTQRVIGKQIVAGAMYTDDYRTKARFVGEIIGQLHLALAKVESVVEEVNILDSVDNWALPRAKEVLKLSNEFCESYTTIFAKLYENLSKQIIHRDPNPGNIICSEEKWGFIDFELSERNVRIYDPCYAATAILSESFAEDDGSKLEKWLDIYKNIMWGYDSVVTLSDAEREAIPYVILANQFVCVAWFAEQEKYQDIFETNKKMARWLIEHIAELKM